jgi:hypothetical protein
MLGNTLVLPLSTGNVTCLKINQDSYSSEYLFKGTLSEHRVKIRHNKTVATATKPAMDRHNIEVQETVFATATVPEFTRKVYVVFEALPSDTSIVNQDGLFDWLIATANVNLISLVNWES